MMSYYTGKASCRAVPSGVESAGFEGAEGREGIINIHVAALADKNVQTHSEGEGVGPLM